MAEGSALSLFISYSHKDESLRKSLGDHLAALQREGVIATWHDRQITAGQDWAGEINDALEAADIVLCLVSAGFLASPYCQDKELSRALERHGAGEALVIPVILKPADWTNSALGKLQALPANAKPVTKWSNRDEAFTSVAQGIRQAARQLQTKCRQPVLHLEHSNPIQTSMPSPRAPRASVPIPIGRHRLLHHGSSTRPDRHQLRKAHDRRTLPLHRLGQAQSTC